MDFRDGKQRGIQLNKTIKNVLENNWFELTARWILGLTFIYASYHKILAPADFAKIIYGYALFPHAVINLIAILLPFIELVAGLALVLGIYPRSAVLIINAMLVAFIIVLSINLIRGHEFDCGCFSVEKAGFLSSTEPMLVRDIIYLLLGVQVFFFRGMRKGCVLFRH
jgi:putative oxidoreductase